MGHVLSAHVSMAAWMVSIFRLCAQAGMSSRDKPLCGHTFSPQWLGVQGMESRTLRSVCFPDHLGSLSVCSIREGGGTRAGLWPLCVE